MTAAERMVLVAVVLAISAALALMLLPTATESTESAVVTSAARQEESIARTSEVRNRTLVDTEGSDIIPVLFIPVALVASPLALRRTRFARGSVIGATVILWIVLLAAMSIGFFYFPAAGAMSLAARRGTLIRAETSKRTDP